MIRYDLTGKKYGRLTVIKFSHQKQNSYWECLCDCGTTSVVASNHLKRGNTKSCGCLNRELMSTAERHPLKHGHAKFKNNSREYSSWSNMIDRCTNKNNPRYLNYGGRGIKVYENWRSDFRAFFKDVGKRPLKCTLDRIDNNGNYEPGNVRWATPKQQANNRRCRGK